MSVEDLTDDKMHVSNELNKIPRDKIPRDKILVDKLTVDKMCVCQNN